MSVRKELFILAEPNYKKFQQKLLPNTQHIIGVRLPLLRKMAKKLAKQDFETYLNTGDENYFEEIMLKGMIIGYLNPEKIELDKILSFTNHFILKIDNWSVCDSFCAGLKIAKTNPEKLWNYLLATLNTTEPFVLRFVIVMFIFYYIDTGHYPKILEILNGIDHENYYVKMAVAWAVSIGYTVFPDTTMAFLLECHLDTFTYNKSLQKIIESKQVSDEEKDVIRSMKHKPTTTIKSKKSL